MRGLMIIFLALATLGLGAALLHSKYTVQEKARELEALADQIHADRKAIRVLRAEWAYRTTPNKLQNQSMQYLALMPVVASQVITSVEDIPLRRNPLEPVVGTVGVLLPWAKEKTTMNAVANQAQGQENITLTAGRRQAEGKSMLVKLSHKEGDAL